MPILLGWLSFFLNKIPRKFVTPGQVAESYLSVIPEQIILSDHSHHRQLARSSAITDIKFAFIANSIATVNAMCDIFKTMIMQTHDIHQEVQFHRNKSTMSTL